MSNKREIIVIDEEPPRKRKRPVPKGFSRTWPIDLTSLPDDEVESDRLSTPTNIAGDSMDSDWLPEEEEAIAEWIRQELEEETLQCANTLTKLRSRGVTDVVYDNMNNGTIGFN